MRCAVCGSTRVVAEIKKEGYNQKKGIIGTALFGIKGAIMGANGNEVTYYHCGDCGQTLNRCMNESELLELNFALQNQTNLEEYFLNRTKRMKEKYPNAGWNFKKIAKAERDSRTEITTCDETLMEKCKKFVKDKEKVSDNELTTYMRSLGYKKEVIKDIARTTTYDDKYKLKLVVEDNVLYYEYYDSSEFINNRPLHLYNLRIYRNYFRDEIDKEEEERKSETKAIEQQILQIISKYEGWFTDKNLQKDNETLAIYSNQKISAILEMLTYNGCLERKKINGEKHFKFIRIIPKVETIKLEYMPKEELEEIIEKEIEKTLGNLKKTVIEMQNENAILKGQSNSKVLDCCLKMVDDGILEKVILDKKTYYRKK